jgi:LPXTG-motif cell wall-anchored protein
VTEYKVVVKDDKIYELPQAGGHGIYWNTILGTLIAMFFAYAGFTMRRRKKGGNEA